MFYFRKRKVERRKNAGHFLLRGQLQVQFWDSPQITPGTDPAVTWVCPSATLGTVPSVRRGQVGVTAGSVPLMVFEKARSTNTARRSWARPLQWFSL